jgi:radical SAM protein with 4Fe4S-binding SPASM domain
MSSEETRQFVGIMERERRRGWLRKSPVVLHRSLQFTSSGTTPYRCTAGDTLITVLPNGDVCPCRRMPLIVGNMHQQPLEQLYQNSEVFRRLRNKQRISSGCEGCFYARTCGGGARCIAFAHHGDPFRSDPGCWLATGSET